MRERRRRRRRQADQKGRKRKKKRIEWQRKRFNSTKRSATRDWLLVFMQPIVLYPILNRLSESLSYSAAQRSKSIVGRLISYRCFFFQPCRHTSKSPTPPPKSFYVDAMFVSRFSNLLSLALWFACSSRIDALYVYNTTHTYTVSRTTNPTHIVRQ